MPLDIMKYHDKFQCSYSNCSENVYYGLFFEKKKKKNGGQQENSVFRQISILIVITESYSSKFQSHY